MITILLLLVLFAPLAPSYGAADGTAPGLRASHNVAEAGFYQLVWQWPGEPPRGGFVLQEATDKDFAQPTVRYRGSDLAALMSGRGNGVFFYRVRAVTDQGRGPWSEMVKVTVDHHSLTRAFSFFIAGAIVFFATLALVIGGARRTRGNG